MTHPIQVMLVDDHAVVREGYRRLLEREPGIVVCAESASAEQGYLDFCRTGPDVVAIDIALPGVSGIELTRRIRLRDPHARILMFSMHGEKIFATTALKAGALGYVTKSSAPELLVHAICSVAAGNRYLSPDVRSLLQRGVADREEETLNALTARELEILRLLVEGQPIATIAERLSVSPKTVSNLQTAVRQKLGAANSAQLILAARRLGIA